MNGHSALQLPGMICDPKEPTQTLGENSSQNPLGNGCTMCQHPDLSIINPDAMHMITGSRRAKATIAFFIPQRLDLRHPSFDPASLE
jgi:hypothetical protein